MIYGFLHQIWAELNSIYGATIGSQSLGVFALLVALHIVLAIATLGMGNRTVCDILRPLRSIFALGAESMAGGVVEITVAVPRAVVYCFGLYFRAYFLAARLLLWLWVAAIAALLAPLVLTIGLLLVHGVHAPEFDAEWVVLSFWPAHAFFYWHFDGRRMANNLYRAWHCH